MAVVLHIITRFIRGGADENTLLTCNAQAHAGHDVHLAVGREVNEAMVHRLAPEVTLHRLRHLVRPIAPLRDARAAVDISRLISRISPDIVHTHTSKAGVVGRIAARRSRRTRVIHGIHILPFLNVGSFERVLYLGLERLLAPATHAFVSVSDGMREAAVANGIGRIERHNVVPSGMPIDRFQQAVPLSDPELSAAFATPITGANRLIVMAAALEPRKRVLEFLDVFTAVLATEPWARLAVLGEGEQYETLMAAIVRLGLAGRVCLPGFRDDIERWIARADVCVLASEREGLPRAVVQYALARRPIVVTALPGVEAIVRDGINGVVVPTHRLADMTSAILSILGSPELAAAMSDASAALDLSAWSTASMVRQLDAIYANALNAPKRRLALARS